MYAKVTKQILMVIMYVHVQILLHIGMALPAYVRMDKLFLTDTAARAQQHIGMVLRVSAPLAPP